MFDFMFSHLLSALVFLPAVGAMCLLLIRNAELARRIALACSFSELVLCVPLLAKFDSTTPAMQFSENAAWIPAWNIQYQLGVDGISVLFVALTALLCAIAILASWKAVQDRVRECMVALLFLETALIGVFVSLDLFLFYLFWEAMLIPLYLLIGVWGGSQRRAAAVTFFWYGLFGSVLLLVGIIAIYFAAGQTCNVLMLMNYKFSTAFQGWVFAAFFIAFAIKTPIFPLHTWLPEVHAEAPTAVSVFLAGAIVETGAYGFLRFSLPFFPDAAIAWAPAIMILSLIAILYGGLMAFAQADFKKLIAYASISLMGLVTLGIFALNIQGIEGALLQMLNHGISISALFLAAGMLSERTNTSLIADYGGIAARVPVYAACLLIVLLSCVGLPGTNGFVGIFSVLLGAFLAGKSYAVIALLGIVLIAAALLWLYHRVAFNSVTNALTGRIADLDNRELAAMIPLVVLVFFIGLFPNVVFSVMHSSVANLVRHIHAKLQTAPVAVQIINDVVRTVQ